MVCVIWIQFAIAMFAVSYASLFSFNITSVLIASVSLYVAVTSWLFISKKIRGEHELFNLKIQSNKFKLNFEIFNSLLSRSESIGTIIPDLKEIVFGPSDSNLEIIIITNPLCGFCKDAHRLIHQVLKKDLNIKIIVRFNLSDNQDSPDHRIASKLMDIYNNKGEQDCLIAMNEVYSDESHLNWLEKWGDSKNDIYTNILIEEKSWCIRNNILFTPEILINGKSYPKEYDFEDAQYFINDLSETEKHIQAEITHA